MREIRFRAWDKKSKKMRVVYCIVYDTNSQFSKDPKIKLVNLWGRIFPAYDDGECNAERLIQREPKHVELMQSTGLFDKNGVEIFNGDILNVANGSINGRIGFSVYSVRHLAKGFTLPYFCWNEDGSSDMNWSHYCEVIGNIYEHSYLLESEK